MGERKELVDRLGFVVEQLRLRAKFRDEYATPFDPNLDNEAAAVIEEQAAEIERLKTELRLRPIVRSEPIQGFDLDAMVAHIRTTKLYKTGDLRLRWVNEGDIIMHDMALIPPQPPQEPR